MSKSIQILAVALSSYLLSPFAYSDYDIDHEIAKSIAAIKSANGHQLSIATDRISGSGFTSATLYNAVEDRMKSVHKQVELDPNNKSTAEDLMALTRAYGSFGRTESRAYLNDLTLNSKARGVRNRAKNSARKLDWYSSRNALMSSAPTKGSEQDFMTPRFIALLTSGDSVMGRWAAEEINRRGGSEESVYAILKSEIIKASGQKLDKLNLDKIAWYCRVLSDFGGPTYRPFLDAVSKSKTYQKKIRKYAK